MQVDSDEVIDRHILSIFVRSTVGSYLDQVEGSRTAWNESMATWGTFK